MQVDLMRTWMECILAMAPLVMKPYLVPRVPENILACMGDILALPSFTLLASDPDNTGPFNMIAELGNCFQTTFALQQNTPLSVTPIITGMQNSSRTALAHVKKPQDLMKIAQFLRQGKGKVLADILSTMSSALVREGMSS
eukprot:4729620-Ditylum_brightwellii.AAC.1